MIFEDFKKQINWLFKLKTMLNLFALKHFI
jgi:hypothetical protein